MKPKTPGRGSESQGTLATDGPVAAGEKNLTRLLLAGSVITVVGFGASQLFTLLTRVLIGRELGPAGLGSIAAVWAFATTLGTLAISGVTPTVAHFVSSYTKQGRTDAVASIVRASFGFVVLGATALAVACLVFSKQAASTLLDGPERASVVVASIPAVAGWALLHWMTGVFRGQGRTAPTILTRDIGRAGLLLAGTATLSVAGLLSLSSAIHVYSLSIAVPAMFSFVLAWNSFRNGSSKGGSGFEWRTWLRYGWPLSLSMLLQRFGGKSLDVVLLAAMVPSEEVGVYVGAAVVAGIGSNLIQGVSYLALPIASAAPEATATSLLAGRRMMIGLGIPALIIMSLWPRLLTRGAFGSEFDDAAILVPIFAFGAAVSCFVGPAGSLLMARGRTKWHLNADLGSIAVFLVFAILLIPRFGAIGAGIARSLSQATFELAAAAGIWDHFRIQVFHRSVNGILAVSVVIPVAMKIVEIVVLGEDRGGAMWWQATLASAAFVVTSGISALIIWKQLHSKGRVSQ